MWRLTIKVFHRHFEGDNSYHIEQLYVSGSQLDNWLKRGNTWSVEIISYCRA